MSLKLLVRFVSGSVLEVVSLRVFQGWNLVSDELNRWNFLERRGVCNLDEVVLADFCCCYWVFR